MGTDEFPFRARITLGLTTTEAGQLVHVTRRTWENWEAGVVRMPAAKRELFVSKIKDTKSHSGDLVVVFNDDATDAVDVVAKNLFLSCTQLPGGIFEMVSLAVDKSGYPYVHRKKFSPEKNQHVFRKISKWRSVLE